MTTSSNEVYRVMNTQYQPALSFSTDNTTLSASNQPTNLSYNSQLQVVGKPGHGYYGSVQLDYNRLDLATFPDDIVIGLNGAYTTQDVLTELNLRFNTFVGVEDIEAIPSGSFSSGDPDVPAVLTAVPASLGWIGEQLITLRYKNPSLNKVVTATTLPVLTFADYLTPKPEGWVLSGQLDFSAHYNDLKLDAGTGSYTNPSAVQALVTALGWPAFILGQIRDVAVSEAGPHANPAFARVIIQDVVVSDGMVGPLMFHYTLD